MIEVTLEPGDTLFVPTAETVYVYGEVNKGGAFPVQPGMTFRQALALAGGPTLAGSVKRIEVRRAGQKLEKPELDMPVQPEDVLGAGPGLAGVGRQLHAAGLAAAAHLHLRLDDDLTPDLAGDRLRLLRRLGDATGKHGDTVGSQQVTSLVLEEIHEQGP